MLEVNGVKKDLKKRLSGISSPCSRPMSNIEGYNYTFYDPDYCWEPFLKYLVDEKQSKKSKCSAPPPKVLKFLPKSMGSGMYRFCGCVRKIHNTKDQRGRVIEITTFMLS